MIQFDKYHRIYSTCAKFFFLSFCMCVWQSILFWLLSPFYRYYCCLCYYYLLSLLWCYIRVMFTNNKIYILYTKRLQHKHLERIVAQFVRVCVYMRSVYSNGNTYTIMTEVMNIISRLEVSAVPTQLCVNGR